jgi:DNA-binding NarL/FixJ family response regulator
MSDPIEVVVLGISSELARRVTTLIGTDPTQLHVISATVDTFAGVLRRRRERPDVIVIVSSQPARDAPPLISRLRVGAQPVPVAVLSDLDDDNALFSVLHSGAVGYLLAETTAAELTVALERIASGQTIIDPSMAGRIVAQIAQGAWRGGPNLTGWDLTPRERQVLESLIEGRSNRQIAEDLNLGQETVKSYLRNLYRKLGARDRNHATAMVLGRQAPHQPPSTDRP